LVGRDPKLLSWEGIVHKAAPLQVKLNQTNGIGDNLNLLSLEVER
jgi:hypothetical protein